MTGSRFVLGVAVGVGCALLWFTGQRPSPDASRAGGLLAVAQAAGADVAALAGNSRVVDLTVLVSETLPAHWGSNPPLQRWANNWFVAKKNDYGAVVVPSEGPYYSQRYVIDEHTGTQTDFPAHFIPPPGSGLPHAGPQGGITGDKYPLERMMGPAAVIDVTAIRDKAEPGKSARITTEMIKAWEKQHGEIKAGDVVLFYSGYTDVYYKPLPAGLRLTFEPVVMKSKPGWPAPEPEAVEYLRSKGVWHLGTDGPSMGHAEGGQPTHVAGLKHGMSWEEMLIGLGQVPPRGAFYLALSIKVADQSGSPTRAIALVPKS